MMTKQHRKHLYRSRCDAQFAGVCGGLAEYTQLDSLWFRLLFVCLTLSSFGLALLIYVALYILIPLNPRDDNQSPRRRCYRSSVNARIAGVCGGLGNYFHVDPLIFRIGFVASLLFGGLGLIVYIALWLITPLSLSE